MLNCVAYPGSDEESPGVVPGGLVGRQVLQLHPHHHLRYMLTSPALLHTHTSTLDIFSQDIMVSTFVGEIQMIKRVTYSTEMFDSSVLFTYDHRP